MTKQEAVNKLVSVAKAELGYREGSNNWNKYADDPNIMKLYGWTPQNQPWCCTFANWCYMTAFGYDIGSQLTYGGTAACSLSASLFRNHGAFVSTPEVGDQAFYYSGGGINHTGIVVAISGNYFTAVEGNYSDKVSSVQHRLGGSDIAGFGRPDWALVSGSSSTGEVATNPSPPTNPVEENHDLILPLIRMGSASVYVTLAQSLLNARGFNAGTIDGEFGAITQAAVNAAQRHFKIGVDGVIGKDTWTALMAATVK